MKQKNWLCHEMIYDTKHVTQGTIKENRALAKYNATTGDFYTLQFELGK